MKLTLCYFLGFGTALCEGALRRPAGSTEVSAPATIRASDIVSTIVVVPSLNVTSYATFDARRLPQLPQAM